MRNSRTIAVVAVALALSALSVALMFSHTRVDPVPSPPWRITQLHRGLPARTVVVEHGLPADPAKLFPEISRADGSTFLVESLGSCELPLGTPFSTQRLPPADHKIVEFLLLLPAASLLVCLFRNVVGLNSFGTFAPALLGLAFRDIRSFAGVAVLLGILLSGWLLRRGLNRFHLLQVPRTSLLLSLVVLILLLFILGWHALGGNGASAISLFPLVILTGMIERFWSMEEEDGALASFRTLLATLFMASCVWLLATIPAVPRWLIDYPETLGLIMAAQLLLGRYTGFRILELHRFRSMLDCPVTAAPSRGAL